MRASSSSKPLLGPSPPQVAVFDFGSHRASPVVLLLDRRDDPITPLLTQWTYQVKGCGVAHRSISATIVVRCDTSSLWHVMCPCPRGSTSACLTWVPHLDTPTWTGHDP